MTQFLSKYFFYDQLSYIIIRLIIISMFHSSRCASSSRVSFGRNMQKGQGYNKNMGGNGRVPINGIGYNNILYDSMSDNNTYYEVPDEQRLIFDLLKTYDPASRPVYNASHNVTINFSFALIQICDMVMSVYLQTLYYK